MSARDEVLRRVREAVGDPAGAAPDGIPRAYERHGSLEAGSDALRDLLVDRVVDYRATVARCGAGDAEIAQAVAAALEGAGARSVVAPPEVAHRWLGTDPAAPGEPDAPDTATTGLRVTVDDGSLGALDLDAIDAVVTGSATAIAETGTIVLDAGALCGRRAITLVPDVHVCVVRMGDVVQSVPEGLARLDPLRPLTFISGPSATSDIELSRVEGVHGPRTLAVVLAG